MTLPGRSQARATLLALDPPSWHRRHSAAVAEVAAWLAARAAALGAGVDRRLVEAAALLHDVDKLEPVRTMTAGLPHGLAGAAWLARQGWPALAPAVAAHPVSRLADDEWASRWLATAPLEERLVAYADKRAGQRLESLADRFAGWDRRYPGSWGDDLRERVRWRARALESDVCARLDIAPDDVRRLRWVGPR